MMEIVGMDLGYIFIVKDYNKKLKICMLMLEY